MRIVFNHYTRFSAIITLLALFTHSVWANTQHVHTMKRVEVASQNAPLQPIMIQGPMPIEAEYFAALLDNTTTEYSGNATLKNIKQISKTGVNRISVGAITHSAKSFDTTLLFR